MQQQRTTTQLDRAAWSCIIHALGQIWSTDTKSLVPLNKMSADEAEWWGRYAYQLATTGPFYDSM